MDDCLNFRCRLNFMPMKKLPQNSGKLPRTPKKHLKPSEIKLAKEDEKKARLEQTKWEKMKKDRMKGRMVVKKVRKTLPEEFEELLNEVMTVVLLKKPCPSDLNNFIVSYLEQKLNERTAKEEGVDDYSQFNEKDHQDLPAWFLPRSKITPIPPNLENFEREARLKDWFERNCSIEKLPSSPAETSDIDSACKPDEVSNKGKDEIAKPGEPSSIDPSPATSNHPHHAKLSSRHYMQIDAPSFNNEPSSLDAMDFPEESSISIPSPLTNHSIPKTPRHATKTSLRRKKLKR